MQGLRPQRLEGIPEHCFQKLSQMEDSFVVGTPSLKTITNHFIEELERGLTVKGGDIPMNVTWVIGYPTGEERGQYLTVDMGGTNLRVCDVILAGREEGFHVTQSKYKMPETLRAAQANELWDFVAECVRLFIQENHHPAECESARVPLAFTFSYPVTQTSIKNGILQQWTKSFDVSDVVGHDVVPQLQEAFERKEVPVDIVALVNDTTGTLIASAYLDPEVKIGSIISTGCNSAYMEEYGAIPKIADTPVPHDALIAINTECGAFDNAKHILPRTTYDENLDRLTTHPGCQVYEKLVAGLYLGELLRLLLIELHRQDAFLEGGDISVLDKPYVLDTAVLAAAENNMSGSLEEIRVSFKEKFDLELDECDQKVCRHLIGLIGTRAARLYACSIAAICRKRNYDRCHVGVDGAVFNQYSHFKSRVQQALREILDWPQGSEDFIVLCAAEDGSGVGAALIAALALKRPGSGTLKTRTDEG